jgi:hypothetical protein
MVKREVLCAMQHTLLFASCFSAVKDEECSPLPTLGEMNSVLAVGRLAQWLAHLLYTQ